jgi:hypothetical protein
MGRRRTPRSPLPITGFMLTRLLGTQRQDRNTPLNCPPEPGTITRPGGGALSVLRPEAYPTPKIVAQFPFRTRKAIPLDIQVVHLKIPPQYGVRSFPLTHKVRIP